ncbi:ABC transporter ATP-binding protein [Methylococcus sp. EFPC2]|uniref:ABC transporter ATP-binding protein n=1 Tax=Methylococcus sp. EFPC2 TaxID=2812648 RepID=UPI0019686E7B|nr:ABC transporter ATP-binding protein [Methylococcus sp. EFPC2]QSA98318.1 ABC transporter ATP-binding protein [Methylococcus sp. EFPC2]
MPLPAITVENLVFEYPGVRALDDVSFSIARGSITALVGPNGAGKTTLLRCIAALDLPLAGTIRVDGLDVLEEPSACHRRLGYLSDSFGLYEALTVRQCLRYAAEANGLTQHEAGRAVEETAGKLGLFDRLEQKTGELSRGLRQRVAIGQAIIHRPGLVLLDEPAAGLDPEARHELSHLFRLLQTEGMTLLVSSHILAELAEYSTDMLILKEGKVVDHRRIAPEAETSATLELLLAEPVADIAERLRSLPGISGIRVDGTRIRFLHTGDLAARHRLLRELIAAGVPVCGLNETTPDMQASYLASVGATDRSIHS